MTTANIYPIDSNNIGLVSERVEGTNYQGWDRAVLMVSHADRIGRVAAVVKREKRAVVRWEECTADQFHLDKGLTIEKHNTPNDQGAMETRYYRMYDTRLVVTSLAWRSIQHVVSNAIVESAYVQADYLRGKEVVFLSGRCYSYVYRNVMPFVLNGKVKYNQEGTGFNMTAYLIPLMILANFEDALQQYSEDPDKANTTFLNFTLDAHVHGQHYGEDMMEQFSKRTDCVTESAIALGGTVEKPMSDTPALTKDTAYALAYTNLFLMIKTGTPVNLKKALEKRLSAMQKALKYEFLDVQTFINDKVSFEQYKISYDKLAFYPKLKSRIFSCVLSTNDPFNNHIKTILKEAQFTVFNLIVTFAYAPRLSMLHVVGEVMNDYEVFMDSFNFLRHRYGENWAYCKLVNQDEDAGKIAKFPHLANAAKAYAFATANTATLGNLQGMRMIPRYYYSYARHEITGAHEAAIQDAGRVREKLRHIRGDEELEHITNDLLTEARKAADEAAQDMGTLPAYLVEWLNRRVEDQ